MTDLEFQQLQRDADRAVLDRELPADLRQFDASNESGAERRTFAEELQLETRSDSSSRLPKLTGYAATFGKLSRPLGPPGRKFREKILPGAFRESICRGDDIRCLLNHNPDLVLGRTSAGTLEIHEDQKGLHFVLDTPDTQIGRDLVTSVHRRDIAGMSFGFRNARDQWSEQNGQRIRTLITAEPFDLSPTSDPAYEDTEIALRSFERSGLISPGDAEVDIARLQLRTMLISAGLDPALADFGSDYRSDAERRKLQLWAMELGLPATQITGDLGTDIRWLQIELAAMDAGNAAGRCVWP